MRLLLPQEENNFLKALYDLVESGASLTATYVLAKEFGVDIDMLLGWLGKKHLDARIALNHDLKWLAEEGILQIVKQTERGRAALDKSMVDNAHLPARSFVFEGTLYPMLLDLNESFASYRTSCDSDIALVGDDGILEEFIERGNSPRELAATLAQSAICQLALPDVRAIHVEDILEARTELKDELLEFRAGILKLTWLLYQRVENKNDLEQIRQEAGTLVNTIIKGSLLSLENRMRRHKKKRIRRMLFGTGRVLVDAGTLSLASLGKIFLKIAGEVNSVKPPEDQVATYLYRLKGKLKYE